MHKPFVLNSANSITKPPSLKELRRYLEDAFAKQAATLQELKARGASHVRVSVRLRLVSLMVSSYRLELRAESFTQTV